MTDTAGPDPQAGTSTTGPGRIVIAGGGLIGLAVAWRSAQRGLSVTVVDDPAGAGAWYAAAGMLAPVTEASYGEEALLALCRESLDRFPRFVADVEAASGQTVSLRTAGTLVVGFDADDMRAIEATHAFQQELGLAAHRLTPRAARELEPSLTPRLRGAVHVPGDYSVDARALRSALRTAAETAGVRIVESRVAAVTIEDGRAAGLSLVDGGRLGGETVVLALGAWSGLVPGAGAPVRPVKGQILRLAGAAGLLNGTVRALVRGRSVYLVPHGADGLIVGATVEEKGFDPGVTAGAVFDLLRDAIEVVPGVTELELVQTLARWRPGTADNAPLLGPSTVPGLVHATGHYRNGVLLTPITADTIADLLTTGRMPNSAAAFAADRFER
jgi:glycine oxidase